MHRFNLMDEGGKDASTAISPILHKKDYSMRSPEGETVFRKYLQSTEAGRFDQLSEEHGGDLGQKLVEADPEVDIERIGRFVDETNTVFLADSGEILYAAPRVEEVRINPEGVVVNTREPVDHEANTQDETPVRAHKKRFTKREFARSFLVARTLQVCHLDGLGYAWLHEWAKALADKGEVQMLAAGPKGDEPLRLQRNGTPHRAFLEGRVDGNKYKMLMHLCNMPLKRDVGPFSTDFKD